MALKQYKPTSPARRGLILVDKSALWKGKPVKALTEGKRKTGGRNNKGHVTSRGIAGGHKQKYRTIDFKRRTWDVAATVERLEYDPNRSAFIALVTYEGGEQAYIIAPQRLAPGDKVIAGKKVDVKPGNAMEIGQMPVGTIVHNVELKPDKGPPPSSQQGNGQVHPPQPSREEEGLIHGPFRLERSVRRAFGAEESGRRAGKGRPSADQDLVASFDDPAAVRRPDLQCLQRPQVRAGVGQ